MKRFLSFGAVIALGLVFGLYAFTVTIGETTEEVSYFPIYTYGGYNYTQQIYTQAQINYQGEITMIKFFRIGYGNFTNSHNWMIYMGHTTRTSFSSTSDWEPGTNLTQVFAGSVLANFPNPEEWMEITLDTPFIYNNAENLVVAIHEYTPGNGACVRWGGFTSDNHMGISYHNNVTNPDVNNPPSANSIANQIAAIRLEFTDIEAPLAPVLVFPENNATIANGQSLRWTLPQGSQGSNGYDVYIDSVLVSTFQPGTQYVVSGLDLGPHTWHVVACNDVGESPPSETGNFNIAPSVQIGDGTAQNALPVNPNFRYSYSQSIFLQPEINISNQRIEGLCYYWNGGGIGTNTSDWIVYMGHVQRNGFNGNRDWVPVDEMMQVFNGQLDIPAEAGWIEIPLDTPFTYNNVDNLVIAVDENTPASDGSSQFFYNTSTPGQNRSIRYQHNSTNPDPNSPPSGVRVTAYPNILMRFGDLPTTPILVFLPAALNFGTVRYGQPSGPLTVVAHNTGSGTLHLTAADISIIGIHANEFSFDTSNLPAALAPGQYVQIPVTVTGITAGEITATLRVVYNGENCDVALAANVLPAGAIIIGDSTRTQRWPFGTTYGFERSAALYTANQIGMAGDLNLSMIAWDCANTTDITIPYRIWAKNTNDVALTTQTWQELTTGATLVKEGTFVPNTLGWNMFQLDTLFVYAGSSLIIGVETNYGGSGEGSGHTFSCTNLGQQRHQYWIQNDSAPTGNGTLHTYSPNIMMILNVDVENDLGAGSINGNLTPTVGIETSYTVRIRNNGSNDQNNYQVKLMGPDNVELASVAGPPISSQQVVEVEIPWIPATQGDCTIYGKVELTGDQIWFNNVTLPIDLVVNPPGAITFTVGDGSQAARIPVDMWRKHSLFETLYFPDEMDGFFFGQITGVKFYNQFETNLPQMPVSIWLGTTTQTSLAAGYIPSTELTLVYDGLVDFPSGENIISISFNEPYSYLDGNNLVMMVRKADTANNSPSDCFKAQTVGTNRSINFTSDSTYTIDPAAPPIANPSGQFPRTTFMMIPAGHISGTVTGANNQALSGVTVSLNNGAHTNTNDNGQYQLINVLPDTYTLAFNVYGYHEHTQTVVIEPSTELTLDVTLQPLPQVSVMGTILASDTGAGIAGAAVTFSGYEPYIATTNAAGMFSISNVFGDNVYNYNIRAAGYASQNGQINVTGTDYDLGTIILNEVAYDPAEVSAAANDADTEVTITWLVPEPSYIEVTEGFESTTFPPAGWTQEITNNDPPDALGIYPTWCRIGAVTFADGQHISPTEGSSQAAIAWSYNHQDEWLLTPRFICPSDAYLSFDSHVFLGSIEGDHYYVKVSTDNGVTWTACWDASAQTGGYNCYTSPITVDLSAYAGNQIKVAFHAVDPLANDGLRHNWFIDNVFIGNEVAKVVFDRDNFVRVSASDCVARTTTSNTRAEPSLPDAQGISRVTRTQRALTGYKVYRFTPGNEQNEDAWTLLNQEPTTELSIVDPAWRDLDNGDYRWAVKAVYAGDVLSYASLSNILNKFVQRGNLVGMVRDEAYHAIAGTTITAGDYSATTNAAGFYILSLPVGTYDVTATAEGYASQTIEDKTVYANSNTTVNFILDPVSNEDNTLPVLATMLNGNYPNPFNPETTISYSVKEAGRVKLV
ncbi:MAG TPA: carboxypeptidase regulatory-like domain-containing protein, partial [Candidatus Cloacimonadota bacterium]|nr:carboxypeptidase regulatory-like domain-containing protein [Candidatus Cloacimonadota bacterium]